MHLGHANPRQAHMSPFWQVGCPVVATSVWRPPSCSSCLLGINLLSSLGGGLFLQTACSAGLQWDGDENRTPAKGLFAPKAAI